MSAFLEFIFHAFVEIFLGVIGSFIWWNIEGRKTKFSLYFERNTKETRDQLTGLIVFVILLVSIGFFNYLY